MGQYSQKKQMSQIMTFKPLTSFQKFPYQRRDFILTQSPLFLNYSFILNTKNTNKLISLSQKLSQHTPTNINHQKTTLSPVTRYHFRPVRLGSHWSIPRSAKVRHFSVHNLKKLHLYACI